MKNLKISMRQYWILTQEYLAILFGDTKNLLISLAFPILASIIVVFICGENMFVHCDGTKSACFVVVSAAIWGGLFNSIQSVVKERKIVKRNYIAGVYLRSYTASRAIIQFLMCVIQSAILCTCFYGVKLYYGNDLPAHGIIFKHATIVEFYITVLLLMYAADALGLLISSFVRKAEAANVLSPYILIVQLIFSGVLFDMKGATNYISYIMISRWGMEGLGSTSNLNELPLRIQLTVPTVPHEADSMFTHSSEHLLKVWLILLVFAIVCITIGNLCLHRVSKDSR